MNRFSVQVVNQLIKEKIIKLSENKYIITKKGQEFRRKFLRDEGIDIADEVKILNKDIQNYTIERIDPVNLKQLIEDGFFTDKQKEQIKFCVENKQPINIGFTKEQADRLMELSRAL